MKNLKENWVILFLFALISCAQVKIKDQEYCGDAGPLGATCFTTLSNQTRDLPPAEWDELRYGQVCTDAKNYADNVAIIQKACRVCKCCTYDAKNKIRIFKKNLQTFIYSVDIIPL
jgi:hypothetical protein